MTIVERVTLSPLSDHGVMLTLGHLRPLARVDALINRLDARDDYAGLDADEASVLAELRAMAAEARS